MARGPGLCLSPKHRKAEQTSEDVTAHQPERQHLEHSDNRRNTQEQPLAPASQRWACGREPGMVSTDDGDW